MAVVDYIYDHWGNEIEIDCLFEELPITYKIVSSIEEKEVLEPIRWAETPIVHERSKEYYGFNYEFMGGQIELEFGKLQGMDIIEAEYQLNGNDGSVLLKKTTEYGGDEYLLYSGKLDLNTRKREGYHIVCTINRESLHEKISSRMDTALKFAEGVDLDDNVIPMPDVWGVKLTSRILNEKLETKKTKPEEIEHIIGNQPPLPVFAFFNTMEPTVNTIKGYMGGAAGVSADWAMIYNNPFIVFEHNGTYTIDINISFQLHSKIVPKLQKLSQKDIESYQIRIRLDLYREGWDGEGNFDSYLKQYWTIMPSTTVVIPPPPTRTIDTGKLEKSLLGTEIEVEAGDRLVFYAELIINVQPAGGKLVSQTTTMTQFLAEVNMTGQSTMPNSKHSGVLIKDCLDYAFNKITGVSGNVKSQFYSKAGVDQLVDGCGANRVLLSGRELRTTMWNPNDVDISITLKNLLSSLDAIDCIGMGYEWDPVGEKEIIRIEPRDYFFRDVEVMKIENISNFSEDTARDYIYNNIEIGYEKYNEEDVNSLDETHAHHEYQLPISTGGKKLQLKSKIILSGYVIEITRRQMFADDDKQATTYDDDTFMVDVKYDPQIEFPYTDYSPITDEPFSSVTGTLSPETTYNMLHTPKRMLIAHAKWLASCLVYKGGSSVIKNTFVKQNRDLETTLDPAWTCTGGDDFGLPLKESADIPLAAFTDSQGIYSPEMVSFKVFLTRVQVRYIINAHRGIGLDDNNYGYLSYVDEDGFERRGWLYSLSYNWVTGEADISLLKKKFP